MAHVLFVRIQSDLDIPELEHRAEERKPLFLEVPGLIQKFYVKDPGSGDVGGIYIFKDQASLLAYRDSELAKTIPAAYAATDVRPEVFELMYPLRPEAGPDLS
jgi:hypothetical protein